MGHLNFPLQLCDLCSLGRSFQVAVDVIWLLRPNLIKLAVHSSSGIFDMWHEQLRIPLFKAAWNKKFACCSLRRFGSDKVTN